MRSISVQDSPYKGLLSGSLYRDLLVRAFCKVCQRSLYEVSYQDLCKRSLYRALYKRSLARDFAKRPLMQESLLKISVQALSLSRKSLGKISV